MEIEQEEFLKRILANENVTKLFVKTILPINEIGDLSTPLDEILSLDKQKISKEGQLLLKTLETNKDIPYVNLYKELKWKILALITIQDIFPGTVYSDYNEKAYLGQYYFYYEGLHILREYFYCGFSNYLTASDSLIRTFLEFNFKQCYFLNKCNAANSFQPLTNYFSNGSYPSPQKMINSFFPNNRFAKPIKKKIQIILKSLSNSSSHAFSPKDSARGNGKLNHEYAFDTLYFWIKFISVINVALWSYFVLFPMLFNPKDKLRKFGFNFPMGLFIGNNQFEIIKKSLDKEDFSLFHNNAIQTDEVKNLNIYYEGLPSKSDEEISNTWGEKEKLTSFNQGLIFIISKIRAIKEISANRVTKEKTETLDLDYGEFLLKNINKYSFWKDNYKKMG